MVFWADFQGIDGPWNFSATSLVTPAILRSTSHSYDSGISSVLSPSRVQLLGTPWTAALQDSGIRKPKFRKKLPPLRLTIHQTVKRGKKKKKKKASFVL